MGTKNCGCGLNWAEQTMKKAKSLVDSGSFLVLGISGDEKKLPFVYTVGCAYYGFPEIIFVGNAPANLITPLFNDLFEKWKTDGVRLGMVKEIIKFKNKETGQSVDYFINLEQIENTTFFENYGFQTRAFYKKHPEYLVRAGYKNASCISVVQFMLPDTNGVFPGEKGFNAVDIYQPVLPRVKKEDFPRSTDFMH